MLNNLPFYLVNALLMTVIIETAIALLIGIRKPSDILNVILANVFTNPIVVFSVFIIGYIYGNKVRVAATVFLELFAFLAEAVIYRKTLSTKRINPFLVSLILNAISFFVGEILNGLIYQ